MKASTLANDRISIAKDESNDVMGIRQLFKKLGTFFASSFKSEWEKKTGLPWREWRKYGDKDRS